MYFSTESSGLLRYHRGVFTAPFKDSDLPRNILTTYKTPDGRLWIGTVDAGIFYVEDGVLHKYNIEGHEDMAINGFTLDSDNNLWVASSNIGVIKIGKDNYELFTEEQNFVANDVYSIEYYDGKLYVGTLRGLLIYSNGKWIEDKRFSDFGIYKIIRDKNENIWFGTTLGLARLDRFNSFEFLGIEDGLPARAINGIVIDEGNNVWLATYRGGLVQLKESRFKNFTEQDGLSYNSINSIVGSSDGRFFIGNNQGKIDIIESGGAISTLSLNIDVSDSRIKDVLIEEDGTLWIGTYKGLIKKSIKGEEFYTKSNGLLSDRIRCINKDNNGSIWVGTRNGGINIITKEGVVSSISKKEGLTSDFIFSLDKYGDEGIIAGTSGGGLNIIYPDYTIEVINPNDIFSGVAIFNVYVENENAMWLATNVGLFYYSYGKFYLINTSKGLAAETIFDVIEDKNDILWMTSIKGVISVNKKEILELVEGRIEQVNSSILDDSDGMITRECTGATKSFLANDGRIWIPTIGGISILDTQNTLEASSKAPSVYIENVIIDDTPVDKYSDGYLNKELTVEPGHRSYVFKFTTLSMSAPKKVHFKYKLEGFDKEWIQGGVERHAKYTNLPYGDYKFKVIAVNNNGVWSQKEASLNLVIVPFFYETIAFYIFLILIFIVFTYAIYKYQTQAVSSRNKELVKLNTELDSFAYSVSHDLKAPLSSIQGLLNVARLDDNKKAPEYYNRIEKSVIKLDCFIKDIINYSKNTRLEIIKKEVKIKNLIEEVIEGLFYLNEENKVKYIIEIDENLVIKTDKTRLVFIANNLISNALRYADLDKDNSFVKISAKIKNQEFVFSVMDNGQGIEKKYHKNIYNMFYRANVRSTGSGLGLYIVKESAIKLGGKIGMNSKYKKGTTMTLTLPL